jgi:hypothetical protein
MAAAGSQAVDRGDHNDLIDVDQQQVTRKKDDALRVDPGT